MSFRWGMVGHGMIADTFRTAVEVVDDATITAVAGRDLGRATIWADANGISDAYGSVDDLLAAGNLDAVYVCTPHTSHLDAALAVISAGVPVLIEKPMTPSAATTAQIIAAAQSSGVFAMEAMWTRFLPIYGVVRDWISSGRIGTVQQLNASFGFRAGFDPEHRLFSPDLAGGSILDIGVYPLGVAQWLFGARPTQLKAVGVVGESGVDEHVTMAASYPGGELAQLASAVRANLDLTAVIRGTDGLVELPAFWAADTATLRVGSDEETASTPHRANGFEYQIEEVMACVGSGRSESERMPLADTLELAELCDEARAQVGVRYPFEANS